MRYGYRPDPPKRSDQKSDRSFSQDLAPRLQAVTSGDVDLRPHCSESNQYALSSCVGNATADSIEILNSIEGRPSVQVSRLFIYTLARNFEDADRDGKTDVDKDDGTYIRLGFEVLGKFGVCREDLPAGKGGWPYDPSKVYMLPDLMAMRAAAAHRIHSYYRIYEQGEARIEKMIEALRAKHPIVFGTQIDDAFNAVRDESWILTGAPRGGHAMIVVGYVSGKGFIVKNSWGKSWGMDGFCFMRPEVFFSEHTRDLWVPTRGTSFRS